MLCVSNEPIPCLCNLSVCEVPKLCTFGCTFAVNNQFDLLEFVFNSVCVDLKYNEMFCTFTAGYMCLCRVCSHECGAWDERRKEVGAVCEMCMCWLGRCRR